MNFAMPSLIAFIVLTIIGILLLAAAWSDFRTRRIPNALVFPGAFLGLLLNALLPEGFGFTSALPGAVGFWKAMMGMGISLAIFLPFYAIKVMGAGDVKLMAMVGAFLGPNGAVESAVIVFITGGTISLAYLIHQRRLGQLLQTLQQKFLWMFPWLPVATPAAAAAKAPLGRLPFATVIAAGSILYFFMALNGILGNARILSIS